ncbi:flagellar basal body P-ring protein FlgI [Haliovirga abyssi]|uniref:Flagellar P-ring protein n=1 Tax=Haliovirga abyssi TaxID=2996794 RepID=A0AAU9DFQ7_9FUSO|nr:flagellar basal body P-ring protein FlgI [Haliovirga abyssi]BDU50227.1 flagellar P-ring protein [Haliovirga abyssi]
MGKKIKFLILIMLIINTISVYSAEKVRLKEIARIQGVRSVQLIGMGIVIGLNGTGDKSSLTPQMLQNLFKYFGTNIARAQIKSSNVAAVMVTTTLPPFKKVGDTIDVTVSSINDAKSLEGGILIQTLLKGPDGSVYAAAQGSLTKVNNKTTNKVNGFLSNGAIVEKEIKAEIEHNDKLVLVLNNPDFTTSSRVADVINKRFGLDSAKAVDAARIEIKKPYSFENDIVSFISSLESIEVEPDRISIIVINEKTGTIVLGENIKVAPVAISQGNLNITIPGSSSSGNSFYFNGPTVKDIVKVLNSVGATPNDIISILQSLKVAGAIDAKIKIM